METPYMPIYVSGHTANIGSVSVSYPGVGSGLTDEEIIEQGDEGLGIELERRVMAMMLPKGQNQRSPEQQQLAMMKAMMHAGADKKVAYPVLGKDTVVCAKEDPLRRKPYERNGMKGTCMCTRSCRQNASPRTKWQKRCERSARLEGSRRCQARTRRRDARFGPSGARYWTNSCWEWVTFRTCFRSAWGVTRLRTFAGS